MPKNTLLRNLKQSSFFIVIAFIHIPAIGDTTILEEILIHSDLEIDEFVNPIQTVDTFDKESPHYASSTRLEDFADYTPGVFTGRSQAGSSTDIEIRGFSVRGRTYVNGLLDNQSLYIRDPATIEKTHILKGHNSVLFGSGSPGGTVNVITKKPQDTKINTIKGSIGSPELFRLEHDITGEIRGSNNLQYRMVSAFQKAKTGIRNVPDDRIVLMPSLRWKNKKSQIDLLHEYSKMQRPFDFDTVLQNGEPVYGVSYVDPRNVSDRHHRRISVDVKHQFNSKIKARIQTSRINVDRNERLSGFYYKSSENDLVGYYREVDNNYNQFSHRAEIITEIDTPHLFSTFSFGAENNKQDGYTDSSRSVGAFSLDIKNPQFDFELPSGEQLTDNNYQTIIEDKSLFVINTTAIGEKWLINSGLRKTWFSENINKVDSEFPQSDSDAISSSLGLSYKPNDELTWHLSRSTSFTPNSPDRKQNLFPPKKATQVETGIRYQPFNKNWGLNLVAYDIVQSNLAIRDPEDRDQKLLSGEQQVKGIELSAGTKLSKNIKLNLSYSHMNGKITKDKGGSEGNSINNVPKHSGALNLNYTFNNKLGRKANLNIGIVAAGKRQGDRANSFEIDGYTRTDFSLNYPVGKKSSLQFSVKNLLDKDYVAASYSEDTVVTGYPRRVMLSFEHKF